MPHLPQAHTDELALDPERLAHAYDLLDAWTRGPSPPIPAAALLVGRRGRTLEPRFFGRQGPAADDPPIRRDAIFLLASVTKPVTYLAAMLLVERGLLALSDPVVRYFPDFAAHHKEQTRVLHLFTHTSGLTDMLPNNLELRAAHAPLARFLEHTVRDTVPLFPPGTNLSYQSMGTLLVAAIVEKITGLPLPQFLQRELFEPLGMDSTSLGAGSLPRQRLVRVQLPPEQEGTNYHWNTAYWQELGAPWGGLFSTPEDFALLCQLMLDRGRAGQRQLVSPRTIERMTANRLNDLADLPEPLRRTRPWGLGWRLNHPGWPDSWGDLLSDRTYGHVGATGTMVWIDPEAAAFFILFTTAPLDQSHWRLVRISNIVAASLL